MVVLGGKFYTDHGRTGSLGLESLWRVKMLHGHVNYGFVLVLNFDRQVAAGSPVEVIVTPHRHVGSIEKTFVRNFMAHPSGDRLLYILTIVRVIRKRLREVLGVPARGNLGETLFNGVCLIENLPIHFFMDL